MDRNKITNLILDRLGSEREQIEKQWKHPEGTTTRHFVVENLLPAEIAEAAYEAFPRDGNGFLNRDTFREKKRTSAHLSEYPTILGEITYAIQSPEVIGWCSDVTGVDHLEPDPSLYAGGLSMLEKPNSPWLTPQLSVPRSLTAFSVCAPAGRPARMRTRNARSGRITGRFSTSGMWFSRSVAGSASFGRREAQASTMGRVTNAFPRGTVRVLLRLSATWRCWDVARITAIRRMRRMAGGSAVWKAAPVVPPGTTDG